MAVISIFIIGSVVIASLFAASRRTDLGPAVPLLSTPFKSEKFANSGLVKAVMTPDGKHVAYTSEGGSKESIWLRQLETSENVQIVPPTNEQILGLAMSR